MEKFLNCWWLVCFLIFWTDVSLCHKKLSWRIWGLVMAGLFGAALIKVVQS